MSTTKDSGAFGKSSDCKEPRKSGRRHPHLIVKITNVLNPSVAGVLTDLSERGFGAYDLTAVTGESGTYRVEPGEGADFPAFTFEAVCRWTKSGPNDRGSISGFEIVSISPDQTSGLTKLIRLFTTDLDGCSTE
jgi:hypothetical protein